MPPLKILLVEDDSTIRTGLSDFLGNAGYLVTTAADGHADYAADYCLRCRYRDPQYREQVHAERCGHLRRKCTGIVERCNALADRIGYAVAKRHGAGSHGNSAKGRELRPFVGEAIEQGTDGVADVVRAK